MLLSHPPAVNPAGRARRDSRLEESVGEELFAGLPWAPGPLPGQRVLEVPAAPAEPGSRLYDLGASPAFRRFMACHRRVSCWMRPAFGSAGAPLPMETQFLLLDLGDRYAVLYPLVDGPVRCSLEERDGRWMLRLETGSPAIAFPATRALLLAEGTDPHRLVEEAAQSIASLLGTTRLRHQRLLPSAARLLGWCSWNAFYENVNAADILAVVRELTRAGAPPRFVILDGGWQTQSEWLLEDFGADATKFPGDLGALVGQLRTLGVEQVFAWQTFNGYWRGSSPGLLGERNSEVRYFDVPPHLEPLVVRSEQEKMQDTMSASFYPANLVDRPIVFPQGSLFPLYDALHGHLAAAGITGVKIDAMTWMEALSAENQGRVAGVKDMVHAAEASSGLHFGGGLIHCSSCSNDFLYHSLSGALVRTSGDFAPGDPASHGAHILCNAMVSFWMSPFIWPDWDMFQTGHEAGWFHAAARAISGGPVYVTDAAGAIDAALLRRLRLSDGTLPACRTPAVPTADSLFLDATSHDGLLKVFARNAAGAVLGAFNCRTGKANETVMQSARFRAGDIPGFGDCDLAVWSEQGQSLRHLGAADELEVCCGHLGFEILTVAKKVDGLAVIGNVNLLNPGGAVEECIKRPRGGWLVHLLDGGTFAGWSRCRPRVESDGWTFSTQWDPASGLFLVELPPGRRWEVAISQASAARAASPEARRVAGRVARSSTENV